MMPKLETERTFGLVESLSVQPDWPSIELSDGPFRAATAYPCGGAPEWKLEATVHAFNQADAVALVIAESFKLMRADDQERLASHIRGFAAQLSEPRA
jgi:hypothetical protein